jgi:hypothetical protein
MKRKTDIQDSPHKNPLDRRQKNKRSSKASDFPSFDFTEAEKLLKEMPSVDELFKDMPPLDWKNFPSFDSKDLASLDFKILGKNPGRHEKLRKTPRTPGKANLG